MGEGGGEGRRGSGLIRRRGGFGRFLLNFWRIGTLVMLAMVYMCVRTWEYVIEVGVRNMYI